MRIKNNTQRFAAFVRDLQESFWGDFQGRTRETLQKLLEADSQQQMAEHLGLKWYERPAGEAGRIDYRNGFYEREYVTPLGVIKVRVSRTRMRSFLPRGMRALEQRSPEVSEMIRQAFLRGISTRGVGRVVSLLTGESVSAQTVSRLTRVLDKQVEKFHHAPLGDDWCYLILDGVWLKVRRAFGPQKVLLLVAYGVRTDGRRQLLAFVRAKSESQAGWEGLLNDLYRRGLQGQQLQLVITDGWPRRSRPCIRERGTSAAGCTRCGICARRCAERTTTPSSRTPNASIKPRTKPPLGERSSDFDFAGGSGIPSWWSAWSGTFRNC